MSILLKIKGAAINAVKKVALFFTVIRPNERQALTNLDLAEIFLALLPAGIFWLLAVWQKGNYNPCSLRGGLPFGCLFVGRYI